MNVVDAYSLIVNIGGRVDAAESVDRFSREGESYYRSLLIERFPAFQGCPVPGLYSNLLYEIQEVYERGFLFQKLSKVADKLPVSLVNKAPSDIIGYPFKLNSSPDQFFVIPRDGGETKIHVYNPSYNVKKFSEGFSCFSEITMPPLGQKHVLGVPLCFVKKSHRDREEFSCYEGSEGAHSLRYIVEFEGNIIQPPQCGSQIERVIALSQTKVTCIPSNHFLGLKIENFPYRKIDMEAGDIFCFGKD